MSSENYGLFVNDNEYCYSVSTPNHIPPYTLLNSPFMAMLL